MRLLVASAKPKQHKVLVGTKVFVYGRIRTMERTEDQCFVCLMKQAAKVCLRMTEYVYKQNLLKS